MRDTYTTLLHNFYRYLVLIKEYDRRESCLNPYFKANSNPAILLHKNWARLHHFQKSYLFLGQ